MIKWERENLRTPSPERTETVWCGGGGRGLNKDRFSRCGLQAPGSSRDPLGDLLEVKIIFIIILTYLPFSLC